MRLTTGTSVVLLYLSIVITACDSPVDPTQPALLSIQERQPVLTAIGDSIVLTARVFDRQQRAIPGAAIIWETASPAIVSVSPGGVVTARGNGKTLLTARYNSLTDTTTVTVAQTTAELALHVRQPTLTAIGDSVSLALAGADRNGHPLAELPATWQSSDTTVATVNAEGIAVAVGNGQTLITARVGEVSDTTTVTVAQEAARLVFAVQPMHGLHARPLDPAVAVRVEDSRGHPVSSTRLAVALSLLPTGTLVGTTTANSVDGVATFTDLAVAEPGRGYRLRAEVPGAPAITSDFFDAHLALATVSAGGVHTCGLTSAGVAYCWGENSIGRVGDGTTSNRSNPVRVAGTQKFASLQAGSPSTWAVTSSGALFRWGTPLTQPTAVVPTAFPMDHAVALLTTRWHTCTLTSTALPYCWDTFEYAFGGHGQSAAPVDTPTLALGGRAVRVIATGGSSTCAIMADDTVWCAGGNSQGELGNGTTNTSAETTPVLGNMRFTALDLGNEFACGITVDGPTYCWGSNEYQQLGNAATGEFSTTPIEVTGGHRFVQLSLGAWHACALTSDGTGYCWGYNAFGMLGTEGPMTIATPVAIPGLKFSTISAGAYHTCGVAEDGYTYCWGANINGELGDGSNTSGSTPRRIAVPFL